VLLGGDFGAFEDCGEFFGVGGKIFKVELLILDAHLVCVCVFCVEERSGGDSSTDVAAQILDAIVQ